MRKCATLAISAIVTEPCGPATTPSAQRTSATSHCSRCAPIRQSLSRNIRLARADRRHVQQLGAKPHALRIVAAVEAHAADRRERHLLGTHQVQDPHLIGLTPDRPSDLLDQPLDYKARPRAADATIRAERGL